MEIPINIPSKATRGDTRCHYVEHSSDLIVFALPRARLRYDAPGERQRQNFVKFTSNFLINLMTVRRVQANAAQKKIERGARFIKPKFTES